MARGSPKKNKGGRPRKTANSHGPSNIRWKIIQDPPGSLNHYEISTQGEVRRKLKNGNYTPVKAWVTGGPYAAVYLYGFRNATRNRKKCYIHRLVATHFVKGRKKGEVVHHKNGPANNTASSLEWVSVEENAKAKKYFNPDGTRKAKRVKGSVQKPNAKDIKPNILTPVPKKKPAPDAKDKKQVKQPEAPPVKLPGKEEVYPDADEFIPGTETDKGKIRYIAKTSKEFSRAFQEARKEIKGLKSGTLPKMFKQATGKTLKLSDKKSPSHWKTVLLSALESIRRRLAQ